MSVVIAWAWPQWVHFGLLCVGLLIAANQHGKPKTGDHNIAVSIIAITLQTIVLWSGGFWTPGLQP